MSIYEQLLGELPGNIGGQGSTMGNLFLALFRGLPGGMNSTGVGGLAGLVNRFEMHGLGPVINSWLGDGPRLPVTPEQVRLVLGEEHARRLAASAGLSTAAMLTMLAAELPAVVQRYALASPLTHH